MKPLVSFLTPTKNRPELHEQLYKGFCADEWDPKELVVLDESAQPSPFFWSLRDERVRYVHDPAPPSGDGLNHIGRARNRLVALSRGDFIEHRDDDDTYDKSWTTFMLGRLGDADLAKLDVYRIITDTRPAMILEWDTRTFGGEHYSLKGNDVRKVQVEPDDMPPDIIEMFRDGYGYSLIGPRRTFESFPFPDDGTEDFPFLRKVRDAGGKIAFVSDAAHLVLHLVSTRSKSGVYPQRMIGTAGADPEQRLWTHLSRKMVGLAGALEELPSGKAIRVKPGVDYSVLASVADKHTLKSLSSTASTWGVKVRDAREHVDPGEFGVQSPPPGYRLIHVTASSERATQMPWKVPALLDPQDKTTVVKAWSSAPVGVGQPDQGPTSRIANPTALLAGVWLITVAATVGLVAYEMRRSSRALTA